MGLKEVRGRIVERLQEGRVQHETTRGGSLDEKNFLLSGKVTLEEVIELIQATKGGDYSTSKHHLDRSVDVHIFRTKRNGTPWYIKCYLIEPDVWFISVHR